MADQEQDPSGAGAPPPAAGGGESTPTIPSPNLSPSVGSFEAHGVEVGFCSDLGRTRTNNEDRFYVCDPAGANVPERGLLFAVADGMGGHAGGEFASGMAVETLAEFYTQEVATTPDDLMLSTIDKANQAILTRSNTEMELARMGSTLTVALVRDGPAVTIWHIGDSRVFLVRDGAVQRLTHDHSLVADQVRMGLITEAEAAVHPARNVITRALGTRVDVHPDVYQYEVQPGDTLILSSDGLHGVVPEEEILKIATTQDISAEEAVRRLINRTNELGSPDNVTVVLVRIRPPGGIWNKIKGLF